MSKYPYWDTEIHIEDFFEVTDKETKKGKVKKRIGKFKGKEISMGFTSTKMLSCPSCKKTLVFLIIIGRCPESYVNI